MQPRPQAVSESATTLVLATLRSAFGPLPAWKRRDPLSQLVRSLLSPRLEDPLAEAVFAKLRQRFKPIGRLSEAREEEVLACVTPLASSTSIAAALITGLAAIRQRTGILRFEGLADMSPNNALEWLMQLPSVSSTAAAATLTLSTLQIPMAVIDPVSLRVAERLRLVSPGLGADPCREAIMDEAPASWDASDYTELHIQLGRVGETFCVASRPDCGGCPLRTLCPTAAAGARKSTPAAPAANENDRPLDGIDHYLRRRIARLEQQGVCPSNLTDAGVSLGHPELDAVFLGRKLPSGAHHCVGSRVEDGSAAVILAVAATLALPSGIGRPKLLVVQEVDARREYGDLHGPGLEALGLAPADVAFVNVKDGAEAISVADEAVRSRAAPVVLLELRRGDHHLDLALTRRFNLAARRAGLFFFLITPDLDSTSAATTRWTIAGTNSQGRKRRLGAPTFQVELVRNRSGSTGSWTLEWSSSKRRFASVRRRLETSITGRLDLGLSRAG